MPIAKVELTGGAFQDSEGNVLANGYLIMKLSQDSNVNTSQVCSGIEIKIDLDANGDVAVYPAHPVQSVWGNDQLLPVNSFYRVTGYKANGQPSWGPNNQQVIGDGGTFDVGTWVPNSVISWTPAVQAPVLEVNGVDNVDQSLLNFVDSATIAWTDNGDGSVSAASAGGASIPLPNSARVIAHYPAGVAGSITDTPVGDTSLTNANGAGIGPLTISTFAPTSTIGPTWNLRGTGSANSALSCSLPTGNNQQVWGGRAFTFQSAGSMSKTDTSGRAMIGVGNTPDNYNTGSTRPLASYVAFVYEPTTSANWICFVCDGSAITTFVTSIAANSTVRAFQIDYTPSVSAVFKINGTVVATLTTHLPSISGTMAPFFIINPYPSADLGLNCAYLYVSQPIS